MGPGTHARTACACSSWMGGGGAASAPCRSRELTSDTATP